MDINLRYNRDFSPIHITYRRLNIENVMPEYHRHDDHYEVYYLINGKRRYFIEDKSYFINPGDLVFINKGALHRTFHVDDNYEHERLLINFTSDFLKSEQEAYLPLLESIFNETLIIKLNFHEKQEFERILFTIIKEIEKGDASHELYLKTLIIQLLIFSVRYLNRNSAHTQQSTDTVYNKVTDIIHYINEHYDSEDLSLHSIADVFFISPYYLTRIFKNATGFTYVEYLNYVRIQKAQHLLVESDMKVIDIAGKVGFNSLTHFGRVFKKNTQYTPSVYRKIYRGK